MTLMELSQLIGKLPSEWRGMFSVMLKAEKPLLAVTSWLHSEHHSRLSSASCDWTGLIQALCHQEPTSTSDGLVFSSRFLLFPPYLQLQLLTFLYAQREHLTVRDLENLRKNSCQSELILLPEGKSHGLKSDACDSFEQFPAEVEGEAENCRMRDHEHLQTEVQNERRKPLDLWVETLLQFLQQYLEERKEAMRNSIKSEQLYQFSMEMSSKAEDVMQMLKQERCGSASLCNQWQQLTSRWQHAGDATMVTLSQSRASQRASLGRTTSPRKRPSSPDAAHSEGHEPDISQSSLSSIDGSTPSKRREIELSQLSQMDMSQSDSFGLTQVNTKPLDPATRASLACLKEAWHAVTDANSPPPTEMRLLLECNPHQMEEACEMLELSDLSEVAMVTACQHITTLSSELSYSSAELWTRHCILPKVLALSQNCSRVLLGGVIQFTKHFPSPVISELFLPTFSSPDFGAHHADIFGKVIKETFNAELCRQLLSQLLSTDVTWSVCMTALIQTIFDTKVELTPDLANMLISSLINGASHLNSDLKSAKFILAFINKFGSLVSGDGRADLVILVNSNQTFLKKALQSALKKLA